MKLVLVGHRGVGKTSLLKRISKYWSKNNYSQKFDGVDKKEIESGSNPRVLHFSEDSFGRFFCLDEQIEKSENQSIDDIFFEKGEEYFRQLEIDLFQKLDKESKDWDVIAMGAGYVGEFSSDWTILWVQREVDASQSQFLDRPPLDGQIQIPRDRFIERETRYKKWSQLTLVLREHQGEFCPYEENYFRSLAQQKEPLFSQFHSILTVDTDNIHFFEKQKINPSHFQKNSFKKKTDKQATNKQATNKKGTDKQNKFRVEIRDDLWNIDDSRLKSFFHNYTVILSFRDPNKIQATKKEISKVDLWDWPLEFGDCPFALPPISSLHAKSTSMKVTIDRLNQSPSQFKKLAVEVENFSELAQGESWRREEPTKRSFLPLSKQGRWRWYRKLVMAKQPLNFIRLSRNSYLDQPLWWEDLQQPWGGAFCALLGSPVDHSLTPWFHESYFSSQKLPVVAIELSPSECSEALPILEDLGLVCAAVTSPLKQNAADWIGLKKPINTLGKSNGTWVGTNTDLQGADQFLTGLKEKTVAVWGGGGVLETIRSVLPRAQCYSSRTGLLKDSFVKPLNKTSYESQYAEDNFSPEALIWAVGNKNFRSQGIWPPDHWNISQVFDINYSQSSPGLAYASQKKAEYKKGFDFFKAQALQQQNFWSKNVFQ